MWSMYRIDKFWVVLNADNFFTSGAKLSFLGGGVGGDEGAAACSYGVQHVNNCRCLADVACSENMEWLWCGTALRCLL